MQRNLVKADYIFHSYCEKQKELGITASLKSSNIWIVDPARAPKLPSEPNLVRNVALSLAFGLFGGMCLAFGLEKINEKTIRTVEQVQLLSPLPVLGALPLLESLRDDDSRGRGDSDERLT